MQVKGRKKNTKGGPQDP